MPRARAASAVARPTTAMCHAGEPPHVAREHPLDAVGTRQADDVVAVRVASGRWSMRLDPDRRRLDHRGAELRQLRRQARRLRPRAGDRDPAAEQRPPLEPLDLVVQRGDRAHDDDRRRGQLGRSLGDPLERRGRGTAAMAACPARRPPPASPDPARGRSAARRSAAATRTPIKNTSVPGSAASPAQSTLDSGRLGSSWPVTTVTCGGEPAVGHGNAGVGGHRVRRRHARHHLELDSRGAQLERLLPTAAEDERIAALEPHHALAAAAELDEQRVGLLLGERVGAGPLAGVVPLRSRGGQRNHPRVGERVVHERVAPLEQLDAPERQRGRGRPAPRRRGRRSRRRPTIAACSSPASSCQRVGRDRHGAAAAELGHGAPARASSRAWLGA